MRRKCWEVRSVITVVIGTKDSLLKAAGDGVCIKKLMWEEASMSEKDGDVFWGEDFFGKGLRQVWSRLGRE